jgi:hypothetical protein
MQTLWKTGMGLLFIVFCITSCRDEYEKYPKAKESEQQALAERYKALVDDAKKLKPEGGLTLLHHFSTAALSGVSIDDFKTKAGKFISDAAAGKWDKVKIRGAHVPGRLRLLLITAPSGKGALPLVQSPDGWKFDDVDVAFGQFDKAFNIHGAVPVFPPSVLASLAVLEDSQASTKDKVQASIKLVGATSKDNIEQLAGMEQNRWAKAGLFYSAWKSSGSCDAFADAFPTDKEMQNELYTSDIDSFRTLLTGLIECATAAKNFGPTFKVYQGCFQADENPRSEYVAPLLSLANAKPEYIFHASLKAKYKYEEDPVANIMVGALHGEQQSPFVQFMNANIKKKTPLGKLAKFWAEKMADRDKEEPAQPEGQEGNAGGGTQ